MLTYLIRLYLALSAHTLDAHTLELHEYTAHRACEAMIYAFVAPADLPDDATTPLGETWVNLLCNNDPPAKISVPGCECVYDPAYDCDGPDGDECAPWDCTGTNTACDRALGIDPDLWLYACVAARVDRGIPLVFAIDVCIRLGADRDAPTCAQ